MFTAFQTLQKSTVPQENKTEFLTELNWASHLAHQPAPGHGEQRAVQKSAGGWAAAPGLVGTGLWEGPPHGPSGPACCFCRQFSPSSICPTPPTGHNCSLTPYDKLRSLVENTKSHKLLHTVVQERLKTLTMSWSSGKAGSFLKWKFPVDPNIKPDLWLSALWVGKAAPLIPPRWLCPWAVRELGASWHPPAQEQRGCRGCWACCWGPPVFAAATAPRSAQDKVLFFSSFFPLPFSPLITEPNRSSELWGIFTAELHGGGTWFSLCSLGYQF